MERGGFVYILTSKRKSTLYVGITSDLKNRMHDHKHKIYPGSFSSRYHVDRLVYYETFTHIEEAIEREKQLKGRSRQAKIDLIDGVNPEWNDLTDELV